MGNKCDMEDERVVASQRGQQLSDQLGESMPQKVKSSPGGLSTKIGRSQFKWCLIDFIAAGMFVTNVSCYYQINGLVA